MAKKLDDLYLYREKKRSGKGTAAVVLGAVSLVAFIVMTVCGIMLEHFEQMWVGAVGFTAFAFALMSVILGLASYQDRCLSYAVSKVGTLLGCFMTVVWFLIYCVGLAA